ncbi:MAG: heavy-metal-associated domain-containing protein [Clostridiales bacterium]|jgi:copper chaperone CopZ|nr:heavy-metal-associated domain-containing protein [Clostridiales bacterium]
MPRESVCFKVENINDKYNFKLIKKRLDSIKGVLSVSLNDDNKQVSVDYDNTGVSRNRIEESLSEMGYDVSTVIGYQHVL